VSSLRSQIKRVLRRCGYNVTRYSVQTSTNAQLQRILRNSHIDLVLDIGANTGQYAKSLRQNGYTGRIVSFEPLSAAHARLVEASRGDPAWEVAPRAALGAIDGEITIHVSAHSPSSSILEMLPLHEQAVPGSGVVATERAPLARLDQVALPYIRDARNVLLKIDSQGYEDYVLRGASGMLDRVTAIQSELSLVPLYAGQPLFDTMRTNLENLGFRLFALFPGHVHETTGQTLQVDGFFVRSI